MHRDTIKTGSSMRDTLIHKQQKHEYNLSTKHYAKEIPYPMSSHNISSTIHFLSFFFPGPKTPHNVAAPTTPHKIPRSLTGISPSSGTNLYAPSPVASAPSAQSPSNFDPWFSATLSPPIRGLDESDCKCCLAWSDPPPGGAGWVCAPAAVMMGCSTTGVSISMGGGER